ncbi:non-specific lipid transfer protein GPI-anchored 7-like [Typha latifolia]|uniref:non-specific lipid transfer protein GPI-anchored 7-like n=1 Tax=Typha latifolia TaxID=4733 RepID=UPI003C2CCCDA
MGCFKLLLLLAVAVAAMGVRRSVAQTTPSCGSKLVPCGNYINSTNPPDSCCTPLKEAVKDDLPCLCAIFNSPEILKAFNIDREKGLQLAANCGVNSTNNLCGSAGAPTASTNPPPPTPGGSSNAMHGTACMGMTGLISLFLFWWCTLP